MNVTAAPCGTFFTAVQVREDGKVFTVFDVRRDHAMSRCAAAVLNMPPAKYFTEDVSAVRVRPVNAIKQKG